MAEAEAGKGGERRTFCFFSGGRLFLSLFLYTCRQLKADSGQEATPWRRRFHADPSKEARTLHITVMIRNGRILRDETKKAPTHRNLAGLHRIICFFGSSRGRTSLLTFGSHQGLYIPIRTNGYRARPTAFLECGPNIMPIKPTTMYRLTADQRSHNGKLHQFCLFPPKCTCKTPKSDTTMANK